MVARIVTTLLGVALFIYGVVAAISPLPVGAPLAVLGLFMIAGANPAFRPLIRRMRAQWRWFDKLVRLAAPRATASIREVIEDTDPSGQDQARGSGDEKDR
ncbi:MAG: hypothetical protein AAFW81_03990 [Pseudomonadota bacterium]